MEKTMTVWILIIPWDYRGADATVFSSKASADAALEDARNDYPDSESFVKKDELF